MSSTDILVFRERRTLCPNIVLNIIIEQLWPTIAHLKELNQTPNLDKLKAHMYKNYRMSTSESEKYINDAIKDKLLMTTKGTDKNGEEITIYMAPENGCPRDGHDWYCFECHKPGNVTECTRCERVYHSYCIQHNINERDKQFVCIVCRDLEKESEGMAGERVVSVTELNQMLGYAYNRMINKNKELSGLATIKTDESKINNLLFNKTDLTKMLDKTKSNSYKKLFEFQMDCQSVVHCMTLLYGTNSSIAKLVVQTLSDCEKELNEIRECVDCYLMSNQSLDKNWFSKPCNPPHDLVFAKQTGYPFWPSKVIKRDDKKNQCDVRFFGSFHERATIENKYIKPITSTLQQLRITKMSPPLTQALKELKQYQQNLQSIIGSNGASIQSPVRAATAKRPRRRADGSRPRKRSIKLEIKEENNNDMNDEQNDSTNDSQSSETTPTVVATPPRRSRLSAPNNTSTPKIFVKSPIRTRNKGMRSPFQTNASKVKTSPKKSRRALQTNKSSIETKKESLTQYFNNTSEIVYNVTNTSTTVTTTKKSVNNKRNYRAMNGLTNGLENDVSNSSQKNEITKRLKSDETEPSEPTSSLAKGRPVRQSKPNQRYKSPEMEVKIPKRGLRYERNVKKEPNEVSFPSIEQKIFREESNSSNASKQNKNIKDNKESKVKNKLKSRKNSEPVINTLPQHSSPLPDEALDSNSTPLPSPPIVSPKRGRPKGVRNKSTFEKMKNESLNQSLVPPQLQTINKPVVRDDYQMSSSGDCNCETKYNKMIKKLKETLEAQHKEEIKQFKKNLEAVKQLNYRLQNENKELKRESHDKQEITDLKQKHLTEISQIKKKQWCFNCEEEAIYFCCWNTSYCSTQCQQQHWHNGHKKTCRRVNKR